MVDGGDITDLIGVTIQRAKWTDDATCRNHPRIIMDETIGLVKCRDCGKWMSAFHWLQLRAREGRSIEYGHREAQERLSVLRESVAELTRAERNTKARLRKARVALREVEGLKQNETEAPND